MSSLLGVAAATALPSEVWPFRKIFLPAAPQLLMPPSLNLEAYRYIYAMLNEIPEYLTGAFPALYASSRNWRGFQYATSVSSGPIRIPRRFNDGLDKILS